jgi:SlyX protein
MPDIESRLVDLELRFMTLERFAQELSEVVVEQGRTIELLRRESEQMRQRLAQQGEEDRPAADKPPHY